MATILVADDDAVMARLLEFNLQRAGYHVIICREGSSVVGRAKAEKPDVAVFDLMLPGATGLELIQRFQADDALAHIPAIVVTAQGKESTKDELMAAGARKVFTKPFSPSSLIECVAQLLTEQE